MGLFSLTQELAIDLGTANTLIIYNDEVVIDEPSVVAVNVQTGQLSALGREANAYIGRTNPNLRTGKGVHGIYQQRSRYHQQGGRSCSL